MGKHEISEDMINKANTLGGLLISKDTRGVNKAATSVRWNEAARFVNWLNTSQGFAAAYKFTLQPGAGGYTDNENLVLWTVSDAGYDAGNLYRNTNARYFLERRREQPARLGPQQHRPDVLELRFGFPCRERP